MQCIKRPETAFLPLDWLFLRHLQNIKTESMNDRFIVTLENELANSNFEEVIKQLQKYFDYRKQESVASEKLKWARRELQQLSNAQGLSEQERIQKIVRLTMELRGILDLVREEIRKKGFQIDISLGISPEDAPVVKETKESAGRKLLLFLVFIGAITIGVVVFAFLAREDTSATVSVNYMPILDSLVEVKIDSLKQIEDSLDVKTKTIEEKEQNLAKKRTVREKIDNIEGIIMPKINMLQDQNGSARDTLANQLMRQLWAQ